jgi:hypothetical protein
MLRTINAIAHFKGSEHVAKCALRIRVWGHSSTFEKKILRKMAFDRNPMMMIYADKVKVREFVRQRVGEKYLTISFGEFFSLKSLKRNTLLISHIKRLALKQQKHRSNQLLYQMRKLCRFF